MIHLFTDFGWAGPYVGEMKAVIARDSPNIALIDLMHDVPRFNPKSAAYLLAALCRRFRCGDVCLAVVDPGVGDCQRRALIIEADGIRYVGPDNGLFAILARTAQTLQCQEILWQPENLSVSFHGRDLFAVVVARLLNGEVVETRIASPASLIGWDFPTQLAEIIYIDHYGNAVTGLPAQDYSEQTTFVVAGRRLRYARTFSSVAAGEVFWYCNSMGLIEVAANQASASELLGLCIGSIISLET